MTPKLMKVSRGFRNGNKGVANNPYAYLNNCLHEGKTVILNNVNNNSIHQNVVNTVKLNVEACIFCPQVDVASQKFNVFAPVFCMKNNYINGYVNNAGQWFNTSSDSTEFSQQIECSDINQDSTYDNHISGHTDYGITSYTNNSFVDSTNVAISDYQSCCDHNDFSGNLSQFIDLEDTYVSTAW